jgi:hypothetical protein
MTHPPAGPSNPTPPPGPKCGQTLTMPTPYDPQPPPPPPRPTPAVWPHTLLAVAGLLLTLAAGVLGIVGHR